MVVGMLSWTDLEKPKSVSLMMGFFLSPPSSTFSSLMSLLATPMRWQ